MPTPPQPVAPTPVVPEVLSFDTQKSAYHAVGVICDNAGLSLEEKTTIRGCIYQESRFLNYKAPGVPVTCLNFKHDADGNPILDANGKMILSSTDWGICQVNDRFHIGAGADFPSVPYVMANPQKVVEWMVKLSKVGRLSMWVSYSSGEYKQWVAAGSPMWALAN